MLRGGDGPGSVLASAETFTVSRQALHSELWTLKPPCFKLWAVAGTSRWPRLHPAPTFQLVPPDPHKTLCFEACMQQLAPLLD